MHQNEFGSLLRELRENACMTARELAYMFEMEEQEIERWETGESKPPVELVYQLADIYDLPPRDLIKLRNANQEKPKREKVKREKVTREKVKSDKVKTEKVKTEKVKRERVKCENTDAHGSVMPAAILGFALLCAMAGFLLYHAQLGGRNALTVIILSAAVCVIFVLLSMRFEKKEVYEQVFSPFIPESICALTGAVLMAAAGVITLLAGSEPVLSIGMIAAGVFLGCAAACRWMGKKPSVAFYVLPLLLFVAKLFIDFRRWMVDPQIMDYGFLLFASIALMLMTYHVAEFCFDKGKRRTLIFFSLAAVYFGGVSLATAALAPALFCGGGILWAFACAMQALRAD